MKGSRIFLADKNWGRLVVLDATDAGLTEVRGVADAPSTCPVGTSGLVYDLVTLP